MAGAGGDAGAGLWLGILAGTHLTPGIMARTGVGVGKEAIEGSQILIFCSL